MISWLLTNYAQLKSTKLYTFYQLADYTGFGLFTDIHILLTLKYSLILARYISSVHIYLDLSTPNFYHFYAHAYQHFIVPRGTMKLMHHQL